MIPLSPSLDTVGWFARAPELLQQVGSVLLDVRAEGPRPTTLLMAEDAFALAQPHITQALQPVVETIAAHFSAVRRVRIIESDASHGLEWFWFRVWSVQVCEVWAVHGGWILYTSQTPQYFLLKRWRPEPTPLRQSAPRRVPCGRS